MTKSETSASPIVILSIFVIHLVKGAQFLNATWVAPLRPKIVISPVARMKVSLKLQRLDFNTSVLDTISFPTA